MALDRKQCRVVLEEALLNETQTFEREESNGEQMEKFCEAFGIEMEAYAEQLEALAESMPHMMFAATLDRTDPVMAAANVILQIGIRLGARAEQNRKEDG